MLHTWRNAVSLRLSVLAVMLSLVPGLFAEELPETAPTTTWNATRGLSQTFAAESMGAGRLTISLLSSWYRQKITEPLAPNLGTDIVTGTAAVSFGTNSYMDVLLTVSGYSAMNYTPGNTVGIGTVSGGMQGIIPLPKSSPLGLGAQALIVGGTATNSFNKYRADGYDYFLTRTEFDFLGRLMQTLTIGTEDFGFKLHLNEGGVTTLAKDSDLLLLLGAGIQANLHALIAVGLEFNSRTLLTDAQLRSDPFWISPSFQLRTPYYFNVNFGADIALSQDRSNSRALEPFRIHGGIVYSQDLLASRRRADRDKAVQDSLQKAQLAQAAQALQLRADSLAEKARQDSIGLVETQRKAALADSLARVKAHQDSLALLDANKKLSEEKEKRSDAEKQLLSTGMLLLDAVYFESGKTDISINSFPYLNIIAKMLVKYPKLQIEVAGHTDDVGRLATNMTLSQARSESVRLYLMQVAPELSDNLTSRGYGPSMPKASNTSASGRKINRRVELTVLNKDVLKEYNR